MALITFDNYDGPFLDIDRLNMQTHIVDNNGKPYGTGSAFLTQYINSYDGDTVTFQPLPPEINILVTSSTKRSKIFNYDAPELDPYELWGNASKDYTKFILENVESIVLQTDTGSGIVDHYGRFLCWVWVKPYNKTRYYSLNYMQIRQGLSYYGYPYNTGIGPLMYYNGMSYRSWMLSAAYKAEADMLCVHSGAAEEWDLSSNSHLWTEFMNYSEEEETPIASTLSVVEKLSVLLGIKDSLRDILTAKNIDMNNVQFSHYPEHIRRSSGQVVIKDISNNIWSPKKLLSHTDGSYKHSNLVWELNEFSDSQNFLAIGVEMSWGKLIGQTPTYAGTINAIVIEGDYIYVAGVTNRKVRKYDKKTLALVAETVAQTGTINALYISGQYIYAGGDEKKLYAYDKTTMAIVATDAIARTGNITSITSGVVLSSINQIIVGYTDGLIELFEDGGFTGAVIAKHDNAFSIPTETSVSKLKMNGNTLYAACNQKLYALEWNYAIEVNSWSVLRSVSYGGVINDFAFDSSYVYVVGASTNAIMKYDLLSFEFIAQSSSYGTVINTIAVSGESIYIGGLTAVGTVKIYGSNLLPLIGDSPSYGGTIKAIVVDGNYFYVGGITNQKVNKHYDAHVIEYIREEL